MRRHREFLLLLFSALLLSSCSSARECSTEEQYTIEYFTGGGFTGMDRGVTIQCSGRVVLWDRQPNATKVVTDSLLLSSSRRETFDALMNDPSVFAYAKNAPANFSATLELTKAGKHTVITYNPSEPPADLPQPVRAILAAVATIKK